MITVNVKLCKNCMQILLKKNPYIDHKGNSISLKGIRIRTVSHTYCDHNFNGVTKTEKIELTPYLCDNCQQAFYIRAEDRPTCPSCHSVRMRLLDDAKIALLG